MSIRIVLVGTSHPGNIGSAARAMKTMGLESLYLVAPERFPATEAIVMAAGADDVLQNARVVPDVRTAIADCGLVVGTTARGRHLSWPRPYGEASIGRRCRILTTGEVLEIGELPAQPAQQEPRPAQVVAGSVEPIVFEQVRPSGRRGEQVQQ